MTVKLLFDTAGYTESPRTCNYILVHLIWEFFMLCNIVLENVNCYKKQFRIVKNDKKHTFGN